MTNLKYFSILLSIILYSRSGVAVIRCPSDLQWSCDNDICIESDKLCDGTIDCTDGSDESTDNCIHRTCPSYAFRCSYGACVPGSAKCNGECNCADGSDELEIVCKRNTKNKNLRGNCRNSEIQCVSSECIDKNLLCNGIKDCSDGSDETLAVCAKYPCPQETSFQCAYGGCISNAAKCNSTAECYDGSDEAAGLCGKERRPSLFAVTRAMCPLYGTTDTKEIICADNTPIVNSTPINIPTTTQSNIVTPAITYTSTTTPIPIITSTTPPTTTTTTTTTSTTTPTPTTTTTTSTTPPTTTTTTTTTTSTPAIITMTTKLPASTMRLRCRIPADRINLRGEIYLPNVYTYVRYKPGNTVPPETIVNFWCENGYKRNGVIESFCRQGIWEYEPPTCEVQCNVDELKKLGWRVERCSQQNREIPCQNVPLNAWAHVKYWGRRSYMLCSEDGVWLEY